jgi:hypothetical protein
LFLVLGLDHEIHGGRTGRKGIDAFGMGTEITTDDCVGITGFRVMLFGGYIFGVPEGGNCWDMLEDVLGSYNCQMLMRREGTFSH